MLPRTPSEVHGRVYDRGILYLHHHTPSHVAATQQQASDVLGQLLTPLSFAEYPTTFGPKDIDPFVPLLEAAKACGNPKDLFPALKADAATKTVLRGLHEELKKRERMPLAGRFKGRDSNPFLSYLQPLEPLLSRRAVREGEEVANQLNAPTSTSQLFLPHSKHFISGFLAVEPMPIPRVAVEDALNLRWTLEPGMADQLRRITASEKQVRRPLQGVWDRWDKDAGSQDIPLPITLHTPLFPGESRFSGQPDFHGAADLVVGYPHLQPSALPPINPMEVISLYWMDIGVDWVVNPLAIWWLDEFDDVPFADDSEVFDSVNVLPTKSKPLRLPPRVKMEQQSGTEDWGIETPLLPWRHSDATLPMNPLPPIVPRNARLTFGGHVSRSRPPTPRPQPASSYLSSPLDYHEAHWSSPTQDKSSTGTPSAGRVPSRMQREVESAAHLSHQSPQSHLHPSYLPETPSSGPYIATSSDRKSEVSKKRRLSDATMSSELPTPAPASRVQAAGNPSSAVRLSQFYGGQQKWNDVIHSAPTGVRPSPPTSYVAPTAGITPVAPSSEADFTRETEISSVLRASSPTWVHSPLLRNPDWYSAAANKAGKGLRTSSTLPALGTLALRRERSISRALAATIKVTPTESNLQGADLVLSTRTAVVFLNLQTLKSNAARVVDGLKTTAVYYSRVIVVFEVLPYDDQQGDGGPKDPLEEDFVKALPPFRRRLEAFRGALPAGQVLCVPDIVFACRGAAEVAGALYTLTVNECRAVGGVDPAVCLEKEPSGQMMRDELKLITDFFVNAYTARLLLTVFGSLTDLIRRSKEARGVFGELIDPAVWARFYGRPNAAASSSRVPHPAAQTPVSNTRASLSSGRTPPTPTPARPHPATFRLRSNLPPVPKNPAF